MKGSNDVVMCGICNELLDFLTVDERQAHYDVHFNEPGPSSITSRNGNVSPPKHKTASPPSPKENVFWHTLLQIPPPKNYTPGLIPVLKRTFTRLHTRGLTNRVVLCADGVCYVGTEWFDFGWGCGYRNFLMACTSLITQQRQPMYFPLLDIANGSVSRAGRQSVEATEMTGPGVRGLQAWIEDAWRKGYDPEGAGDKSMKWHLVGTRKFIGAADISVAFSACGIPCDLVDFPGPPKPTGRPQFKPSQHEQGVETSSTALIRWIVNYFDNIPQPGMPDGLEPRGPPLASGNAFDLMKTDAVIISPRMPIILQHNGHSRTIIGYEMTKNNSVNLLIFDPAPQKQPSGVLRKAALAMHYQRSASAHLSISHPPSSSQWGVNEIMRHIRQLTPKTLSLKSKGTILNGSWPLSSNLGPPKADEQETVRPAKRLKIDDTPTYNLVDSDEESAFQVGNTRPCLVDGGDEIVETSSPTNDDGSSGGVTSPDRPLKIKTEAEKLCDELDPIKVARLFRVNNFRLSRKAQYQILFFPLTDPLNDLEKEVRKVVTSTTIDPDRV